MPMITAQTVQSSGVSFADVVWMITTGVVVLAAGMSMTWWFTQRLGHNRKVFHDKLDQNKESVELKIEKGAARVDRVQQELSLLIASNASVCTDTKERVSLLENANDHLGKRIDTVATYLETLQKDVTLTKDTMSQLLSRQNSSHLEILGEMKAMEGRIEKGQLTAEAVRLAADKAQLQLQVDEMIKKGVEDGFNREATNYSQNS